VPIKFAGIEATVGPAKIWKLAKRNATDSLGEHGIEVPGLSVNRPGAVEFPQKSLTPKQPIFGHVAKRTGLSEASPQEFELR
jgi:hypothetical protein